MTLVPRVLCWVIPPQCTCCPSLLIPRKTSSIIIAITYTIRGSTRGGERAIPSETMSVRQHRTCRFFLPYPRIVRANCKCTGYGRRSTSTKKGSGADANFPSLVHLLQSTNAGPTPVSAPTAENSYRHYGGRCASPERRFCEGWCRDEIPRRATLGHPDVVCCTFSRPSFLHIYSLGFRSYPYRLPMTVRSLGMHVRMTVMLFR